jgi:regulator of protease activity HflC (stomatin/prohibitin superfamily)
MSDDLITWERDQIEALKLRAETLRTMARALPAEAGAYLTETADLLLAEVDAKRRILDAAECAFDYAKQDPNSEVRWAAESTYRDVIAMLALSPARPPGYRESWKP